MAPTSRERQRSRFARLANLIAACGLAACGSSGHGSFAVDPPPPPSCPTYCSAIQSTCTGDNQQYSDMDDCLNSCSAFTLGLMAARSGDSLSCRTTYAHEAAISPAMAALHCTHAGPGGGGVCGDDCAGYCDIAMKYCTAANQAKVYDTREACLADCATRQTDAKLNAGDGERTDLGNEVACLLYHAQMGSSAPVGHCLGDLALDSGTCR